MPQVSIRVGRGVKLRGRVLTAGGEPIPGAKIVARQIGSGVCETASSVDGSFDLNGLALATVSVLVEAEGFDLWRGDLDPRAGSAFEMRLVRLSSVSGRVTFEGTGQAGVKVEAAAHGAALSFSAMTAMDGSFEIRGVPPGGYSLTAKAEGFSSKPKAVDLESGVNAMGVVLELEPEK